MEYLNIEVEGSCPVCNSTKGLLLYKIKAIDAVRHFRLKKPDKNKYLQLLEHVKDLWKGDGCSVIMCENCQFCYSYPFIGGDSKFYNLAYERSGYPNWKFEFEKTLGKLKSLIKSKELNHPLLLEIAAGDGAFLKALLPELVQSQNVYCTEYSEYGIEELRRLKVNVIKEDFRLFLGKRYKSCFDVVCLFQVLEHLDKLKETFDTLNYITRNGAFIFIAVPNPNMIKFNEKNNALLDMPPNHIGRWNLKSFEIIIKGLNWVIVDYQVEKSSASKALGQFCNYKYLKNKQQKNSFVNLLETYPSRLFSNRFYSLKKIILNSYRKRYEYLVEKEELGNTQWICFKKEI